MFLQNEVVFQVQLLGIVSTELQLDDHVKGRFLLDLNRDSREKKMFQVVHNLDD